MASDNGTALGKQRVGRAIGAIIVASFVLKVGILMWLGPLRPVADEYQYVYAGESIASGYGIDYTNPKWDPLYQPPLYPYLMGLAFALGGGPMEVKLVQIVASTVTVWLLFLLARDWFDHRTAVWTAALYAFYPTLIAFTHYNWTESIFGFWLVSAIFFLFEPGKRIARPTSLLLAGVLLGMAALTRAVAAYLVPCLIPLIHLSTRDFRSTATRATALVLGFAIAIAPLTWSIYREWGGFLLISTQPAKIWHESYNSREPENVDYGFEFTRGQPDFERPRVQVKSPIRRHRLETHNALEFIAENPVLCAKRFYQRLTFLYNPSSFLVRHLREGWYSSPAGVPKRADIPPAVVETIVALTVASYLVVATLGLLGLFAMPPSLFRPFAVGLILFFSTLTALTYATSRYRLPFLPVLIPSAAWTLTHFRVALAQLRSWRGVLFALVYGVLVYWWSLYIELIWQ